MSELEIEFLVGQMILTDLRGIELKPEMAELLKKGLVSGVILFPGPEATPVDVRRLTDEVRAVCSHFEPIIAIDQEGGRVARLKNGFTRIPAMRNLGEKNDEGLALEIGRIVGKELRSVGVNLNFAPVVDLDLNPENKVIGDRSLGADPQRVSCLASALIRGLHSEKVLGCAKHFPGHGASREDSHQELPVVDADQETVRRRELIPFRSAIEAGVKSIMVAHLKYPAFDRYYPASLSERIIQGLLCEEMRFEGVVITDSLEMKALETIPLEDRAYMAVRAGADIVLISDGIESARKIHSALCTAVKMGALGADRIYSAYERVRNFKENLFKSSELPPVSSLERMVGISANI
jgi:beta-N-acetylhexosaminidase